MTSSGTMPPCPFPEPVDVKSKDIGEDNFNQLLELFKNTRENKVAKIENFLKTHGLDLDTVPCYKKNCKWAVTYGRNGGGRYSHGNELRYYFLANFKDADIKDLLQRDSPVHTSHVYTVAELATIFDVQLEYTG